jgi:ubiquitin C-terminal hydrolase
MFSLARFEPNWETGQIRKLNTKVEFPLKIDMKPYIMTGSNQENDNLEYELKSIIVHLGTPSGGHYMAYI